MVKGKEKEKNSKFKKIKKIEQIILHLTDNHKTC